jgi:hypothetical protein
MYGCPSVRYSSARSSAWSLMASPWQQSVQPLQGTYCMASFFPRGTPLRSYWRNMLNSIGDFKYRPVARGHLKAHGGV